MPRIKALETSSSTQQDGLNHQAIEDYLKTIHALAEIEAPVNTSRIAKARRVKPGSVTSMLQRLAKLNLINYEKRVGVTSLTESGEKIALEVIRHHRLLELYLIEALGFSWDEVHEQADILEHVISEKLEDRISAVLGHPTFDPHGDPIPDKDGIMIAIESKSLASLAVGKTVQVTRIADDANSEMLRYLAELGLIPGVTLTVLDVAPFDGPLTINVGGKKTIIGYAIANSVLVTSSPLSNLS